MDELARLIMTTAGYEAPIKHLGDKPQGVQNRVADIRQLHQFYVPQITLTDGVQRALEPALAAR
jgi:nucleoside-diphosphate-sugar epimerase